mmetsp:Transcript_42913/g.98495  ORF Transcript_42913/g.98495 Transcript_42913/m.98495 type:complete len:1214 (-) Transcript_42913:93-3734(-)
MEIGAGEMAGCHGGVRAAATKNTILVEADVMDQVSTGTGFEHASNATSSTAGYPGGWFDEVKRCQSGASCVPYQVLESCALCLWLPSSTKCLVTARIGPLLLGDVLDHETSFKLAGHPIDGSLSWVVENLPLARMASVSPTGQLGCRFKIWVQDRVSRAYIGRSAIVSLPSARQHLRVGALDVDIAIERGVIAEGICIAQETMPVKIVEWPRHHLLRDLATQPNILKREDVLAGRQAKDDRLAIRDGSLQALAQVTLQAADQGCWGTTAALVCEIRQLDREQQQAAIAKVDKTKRNLLRLCVDGMQMAPLVPLQEKSWCRMIELRAALHQSTFLAMMCRRRPYFWRLKITEFTPGTMVFTGEICIGVPTASGWAGRPAYQMALNLMKDDIPTTVDCTWSEAQLCLGKIEVHADMESMLLRVDDDVSLTLSLAHPGQQIALGHHHLRNNEAMPRLVAEGQIAGSMAKGFFDVAASSRLYAEMEWSVAVGCGLPQVASAAVALGADPHALAEDGLSAFTAALIGEDPGCLLADLDLGLRRRISQGDRAALTELADAADSHGYYWRIDLVALALYQGWRPPVQAAEDLLRYSIEKDIPVVANMVLDCISGHKFALAALEHDRDSRWLEVANRMLAESGGSSSSNSEPEWCQAEALEYALARLSEGRTQFWIVFHAFFALLEKRELEVDYWLEPIAWPDTNQGRMCPVCFESMCRGRPDVFMIQEGAACAHFLCSSCSKLYSSAVPDPLRLRCMECRRQATHLAPLPCVLKEPFQWFKVLASPDGLAPRQRLLHAVAAILPIDVEELSAAEQAGNLSGVMLPHDVSIPCFLDGFLKWLRRQVKEFNLCLQQEARLKEETASGSLVLDLADATNWFRCWAFSNRDFLRRSEVLRGLLHSLQVSSLQRHMVDTVKAIVEKAWRNFMDIRGLEMSQAPRPDDAIDLVEFTHPSCGLAALLKEELLESGIAEVLKLPKESPMVAFLAPEPVPEDEEVEPEAIERQSIRVQPAVESGMSLERQRTASSSSSSGLRSPSARQRAPHVAWTYSEISGDDDFDVDDFDGLHARVRIDSLEGLLDQEPIPIPSSDDWHPASSSTAPKASSWWQRLHSDRLFGWAASPNNAGEVQANLSQLVAEGADENEDLPVADTHVIHARLQVDGEMPGNDASTAVLKRPAKPSRRSSRILSALHFSGDLASQRGRSEVPDRPQAEDSYTTITV